MLLFTTRYELWPHAAKSLLGFNKDGTQTGFARPCKSSLSAQTGRNSQFLNNISFWLLFKLLSQCPTHFLLLAVDNNLGASRFPPNLAVCCLAQGQTGTLSHWQQRCGYRTRYKNRRMLATDTQSEEDMLRNTEGGRRGDFWVKAPTQTTQQQQASPSGRTHTCTCARRKSQWCTNVQTDAAASTVEQDSPSTVTRY